MEARGRKSFFIFTPPPLGGTGYGDKKEKKDKKLTLLKP
jgi:hypothetical protein